MTHERMRSETIIFLGVSMVAHRNPPIFPGIDHSPIVGRFSQTLRRHLGPGCGPEQCQLEPNDQLVCVKWRRGRRVET